MFIKKFLLLSLACLAEFPASDAGSWCHTIVPVQKFRTVTRSDYRRRTWYGFWGNVKSEWEPYTYMDRESYWLNEMKWECCKGYRASFGNCIPICTPACPANSECTEPDTCHCQQDYKPAAVTTNANRLQCRPVCLQDCPLHAHCAAPFRCACDEGYQMVGDHVCEPICTGGCGAHSYCKQPEQCACHDGYLMTKGGCEPQCRGGCAAHSRCVAPNSCSCDAGYRRQDEAKTADYCAPICVVGCPAYSSCVAPEECRCSPGYTMNANGTQCEALCIAGCPPHSVCNRPDECLCEEGYRLSQRAGETPHCAPICQRDCSKYGKCVAPNVCACLPGYELQTADAKQPLCRPVCSQGCEHGLCFAPEQCVCNLGYLMGPNNTCAPVCSLGCSNGVCVAPEMCACSPGYRFAANSVHLCEPVCEPACLHADCVAPNTCICWPNYEPNVTQAMSASAAMTSIHECVPVCRQGCHSNGYCSAPDVCSCNEGYEFESKLLNLETNGTLVCVPKCSGCSYGDCVAPEKCVCWTGFELNIHNHNSTEICTLSRTTTEELTTEDSTTLYSTDSSTQSTEDSTSESAITELYTMTDSTSDGSTSENTAIDSSTNPLTTSALALHYTVRRDTLSPGHTCDSYCRCWIEFDDFGALSTAKCQHVCVDAFDAPCLDLRHCQCNANTLVLTCNSSQDYENSEQSVEDVETISYMCRVRSIAATTSTKTPSMKLDDEKGENVHTQAWIWILCSILAAVIVALMLYVAWRHMPRGRTEDDGIVSYHHSDTVELTLNS